MNDFTVLKLLDRQCARKGTKPVRNR